MKPYKRIFKQWEMDTDQKPKGKDRRIVGKLTRQSIKRESRKQLNQFQDDQLEE